MKILDGLTVFHGSEESRFELYQGDLSSMPPEEAVDVLVVSAFPDDYTPTPGSLIGALAKKGVSLAGLAEKKAVDLRGNYACWLSEEIMSPDPGIQQRGSPGGSRGYLSRTDIFIRGCSPHCQHRPAIGSFR